MTDEIFIPDTAFDPKPWWKERPSDEIVSEILRFIGKTGKPHLWAGQTYTKPPADAFIVYLAEFDLPDRCCTEQQLWAPCPCCTPRHPKYCRKGKVAYFPNEHVIRIIGPHCFRHINEHGHLEALRSYNAEQSKKSEVAYLLNNLGLVPVFTRAVEQALPVAKAVDEMRVAIRTLFDDHFRIRMWDHVRGGELKVTKNVRSGDSPNTRDMSLIETYGQISGHSMLKPRATSCDVLLSHSLVCLQQLAVDPNFAANVTGLLDTHRRQAAKLMREGVKNAQRVFEEIREVRQFTSKATLATLNGWGRTVGAPLRFQVAFEGSSFYMGRDKNQFRRIEVPAAYHLVLPDLPRIRTTNAVDDDVEAQRTGSD